MNNRINKITPNYVNLKAYFFLILSTMCWGLNTIFGQLAVGEVSPMAVVMLRWFGVLVISSFFFRKYVSQDWPLLRQKLLYIFAMGGLGYAGFNGMFYIAAHSTSAVNIGILQGAIPIFILLGSYLIYKTKITLTQFYGVIATLVGVGIVGVEGSFQNLSELVFRFGDVIMLLACSLYAGYTIGLRQRPVSSAIGLFTLMAGVAFIVSLPLVGIEVLLDKFLWPTSKGWVVVGLITLLPSLVAQILFIKGVEIIGPSRAGIFANLVPVFGSLFAVFILGERFMLFQGVGMFFVLGGIWLSERGKE